MPHRVLTGQRTDETFLPPEKLTAFDELRQTLDDPFSGTGIQNVIQALLQSLVPGEQQARQKQADEFRKAGAISDASFAVASSQLETGLQRERSTTAARGFLDFLGPLLSGRETALTGIPALSRSQSTQFGFPPRTGGRVGGGRGVDRFGRTSIEDINAESGERFRRNQLLLNPRTPSPSSLVGGGGNRRGASGGGGGLGAVAFGPGSGVPSTFFRNPGTDSFSQNPPVDSSAPSGSFVPDFDFLFNR